MLEKSGSKCHAGKVRELMPCRQIQGAHAMPGAHDMLAKSGSSCHAGKSRELMPCWPSQGAHAILANSVSTCPSDIQTGGETA